MIKHRLDFAKKYLDDAIELFNKKRFNSCPVAIDCRICFIKIKGIIEKIKVLRKEKKRNGSNLSYQCND